MWVHDDKEGALLSVRLTPGASKDEALGVREAALAIRLCARPVEGKANKALIRFLAQLLGVAPSRVRVVRGATSRTKTLLVMGMDAQSVRQSLVGQIPTS
jgi:uncharacterized protein (TIGR00251 family)